MAEMKEVETPREMEAREVPEQREIEAREVPEPRETLGSLVAGKTSSCRDTGCCQKHKCSKIAGWYWRRERLTSVILFCTVLCVVGDVLLAAMSPHVLRQAKRTLEGVDTFTDVGAPALKLNGDYWQEVEDFLGTPSLFRCATRKTDDAINALARNCSAANAAELVYSVDRWFDSAAAFAYTVERNQLNCTGKSEELGTFWDSGPGYLAMGLECKELCRLAENIQMARYAWEAADPISLGADLADAVALVFELLRGLDATLKELGALLDLDVNLGGGGFLRKSAAELADVAACLRKIETVPGLSERFAALYNASLPTNGTGCAPLHATNATNATDCPFQFECEATVELPELANTVRLYKKASYGLESLMNIVNDISHILKPVSADMLVWTYLGSAIIQILIMLMVHRAVYSHEISEFYARATSKKPPADAQRPLSARASGEARRVRRACHDAWTWCDHNYVIRFSLAYVLSNVLLLVAVVGVAFTFAAVFLGNKENCVFLWEKTPWVKTQLRHLKHSATRSCFRGLRENGLDAPEWTNEMIYVDCTISDDMNAIYDDFSRSDRVIATIAAAFILIGNWFLCQWLAAAFSFAKTRRRRESLHSSDQKGLAVVVVEPEALSEAEDEVFISSPMRSDSEADALEDPASPMLSARKAGDSEVPPERDSFWRERESVREAPRSCRIA